MLALLNILMKRVDWSLALHTHEYWMKKALELATKAGNKNEVPVGALIVRENQVISSAYNMRETWKTPLGHAEMIAIHRASQRLGSWRLLDTTLYVTLEPCAMCAGLLVQARIKNLVFGALDGKAGAVRSVFQIADHEKLNHQIDIVGGVLQTECGKILSDFFKSRRD